MKLKKLRLENIRSHKDTEVNFNSGITVFTGRTGCGKSTILMGIQYALFGSDSTLNNSGLLRRGKVKGKVELEFDEKGDAYKVVRGLKRQGKTITVDVSNMAVYKNGQPLPLLGRANDLNETVLNILNYPKGLKARELFEVTSYTKQDEIRALIELKPEKRQEYIDKILQLSKYKTTWENLREVISHFESELKEKKIKLENLESQKSELMEYKKRQGEINEKISEGKINFQKYEKEHLRLKEEVSELNQKLDAYLKSRRLFDEYRGKVSNLEKNIVAAEQKLDVLGTRKETLEKEIAALGETEELSSLKQKDLDLQKKMGVLKFELEKNQKEVEQIKNLGVGKCPRCKQEVSQEHISNIEIEHSKQVVELKSEIDTVAEKINELGHEIEKSEKLKEKKESIKTVDKHLDEIKRDLESKKEELSEFRLKLSSISVDEEDYQRLSSELTEKRNHEKEMFSNFESQKKINGLLSEELAEVTTRIESKSSEVEKLETDQKDILDFENQLTVLTRLREDIRNIREIVRRNFLEDFRQEFQKKFEEIRRFEEEYSVDIKQDYEPVTFTSRGEETSTMSLSGGEKTSVALAYRLALSDLAAQVSDIHQSEVLILDEPTTGFDQEDVKSLPDALKSIETIPQMIIVTHEEELKNAGDYKFEIIKKDNESEVSEIIS